MEVQQQKLREARKKLQDLISLIDQRAKELTQLRREKKNLESVIESLDDSLGTYSFNDSQVFPWTQDVQDRLTNVFGISSFRGLQETVINCTLSKKDCIYIAATGSGKSLVFQLPALISTGITLVVSPLLSLMEDQTTQLDQLGIPSIVLNSTTSREDFKRASNAMVDPSATLKLIYVTPEKLAKSNYLMAQIEKMYEAGRFARLVIDEVHCCSEWGHDFRKDYNSLHIFKRQYPETPILGLTATATPQVILDIKKMLGIPKSLVYKGSFYRPNLVYEIRSTSHKDNITDLVDLITSRFYNQSGIIYCLTIKDTEDVASKLTSLGVSCQAYHAQLDTNTRSYIQSQWYKNRCRVIAATVAFGLGINKMDVRFVIHYSISKSIENYYQETGRAGRDGRSAHCVCYYRFSDIFRATSLTFRERNGKERVYQMLNFCLDKLNCRKKLIAEYFEDTLTKDRNDTECCDNCRANRIGRDDQVLDASDWLANLLEILKQAHQKKEKMTSNKLIDAWMQVKGPKKFRLDGITRPTLSRTDCETVVGLLLSEGYLREDFHMTPYNTISYIIEGNRSLMNRHNGAQGPTIPRAALESLSPVHKARAQAQHDVNNQPAAKPQANLNSKPSTKVEYIDLNICDDEFSNEPQEIKPNKWAEIECLTID